MQGSSLGVWENNLFTMTEPKKFPNDLGGLRNKIADLQKDITDIQQAIAPSRWNKFLQKVWEERSWSIPVIVVLLGGLATTIVYLGGLILGSRVQSAVNTSNATMQADIHRIDQDTQQLKLMI